MLARIAGAITRAFLVAVLVATPSLLLPDQGSGMHEIVALLALLAASLTFFEYIGNFPSFIEFRDAPPINRMRFISLFTMVFSLTVICKHQLDPTNLTAIFDLLGRTVADLTDFPYSPVRLVILMLPVDVPYPVYDAVRTTAGLGLLIGAGTILAFLYLVRIQGWPTTTGAFNVWVNLPLFDPTAGGDVVTRLQRDGVVNIVLGALLPFLIPALIKLLSGVTGPVSLVSPLTVVWTITIWAFLPTSMVTRGVAMLRIAELIETKRRRAYAADEAVQTA